MSYLRLCLFLCLFSSQSVFAQAETSKLVLNLDLLNWQSVQSKTSLAGQTTKVSTTETKSAKPGGLQVAIYSKGWALMANIAPDTATTGLVGLVYELLPLQYLGIAYNLSSVEFSDATPRSHQQFYGIMGYNGLLLTPSQVLTFLWTLGPTYSSVTSKQPDGSDLTTRGSGTQLTLTNRYQVKINDNFRFSPAIKIAWQSSRLTSNGAAMKRDILRYEIVPIAVQIRIE